MRGRPRRSSLPSRSRAGRSPYPDRIRARGMGANRRRGRPRRLTVAEMVDGAVEHWPSPEVHRREATRAGGSLADGRRYRLTATPRKLLLCSGVPLKSQPEGRAAGPAVVGPLAATADARGIACPFNRVVHAPGVRRVAADPGRSPATAPRRR